MPQDLTDGKSLVLQVMAWCRQATGHHLSWCWPRLMSPYGITRRQCVNSLKTADAYMCHKLDHWFGQWCVAWAVPTHYWNQYWHIISWILNSLDPGGIWLQSQISKFQTHFNNKYLKYFLWNCYQVNATTPQWSLVNIGSVNGLAPSGNKPLPEPMLT